MPVVVDEDRLLFTLHTCRSTYQMRVDEHGYLLHLYYGTHTEGDMSYLVRYGDRGGMSGTPYDVADRAYSLDMLPQECPFQGTGELRSPLVQVRDKDGVFGCDLRYRGHEVREGKYALPGLPAAHAADGEGAQTLCVTLGDDRLGLEVDLLYGVLPGADVVCRAACARNRGDAPLRLERFQTAALDFAHGDFDVLSFHGRHAMERVPERQRVPHGCLSVGSKRGASSHQFNPLLILADHDATEISGRCYALELVWSGSFKATAECDQFDLTRATIGMDDELFSLTLAPGEEAWAPEALLSFSACGLGPLSQQLHRCVRDHVCRGPWAHRDRPVVINSWEACYFDFTGDDLVALARQAAPLGIDMLVVDDGWFGHRRDDRRALGDWSPNEEKLGGTLADLCARVNDAGLDLGIWFEPEMVSEDSDLFRSHPAWAMTVPGKEPVLGRDQLMLDLADPEVRDHLFRSLCSVLDQAPIRYVKWDFNRSLADLYSGAGPDQGAVAYRYVLGLYELLERLLNRYPDLLIEGCAGGGGRFDAGMLYYTPQIWTSDNTDPVNRALIQYGTSFGYPLTALAAHVSASPNGLTCRETPIQLRGTVALQCGAFGYELDLSTLDEGERECVRRQVAEHRRNGRLVREGLFWRLSDPRSGLDAWSFVAPDGSAALVGVSVLDVQGYGGTVFVTPRGLTPHAFYREAQSGQMYPADALMDAGLPAPMPDLAYASTVFCLERVDGPSDADAAASARKEQ